MKILSHRSRSLFFLMIIIGCSLAVTNVTVQLHKPAVLPCKRKCSLSVRWSTLHNRDDDVAQCNQTSCSSKEGFQMSHEKYLTGDLALQILSADYSIRTMFLCQCGIKDICEVFLGIEALTSSLQLKPGEELILDLHIHEPVKVIYEGNGSTTQQICSVNDDSLKCRSEFTQKINLFHPTLNLGEVKLSGNYIIKDVKNDQTIHKYTVSVEEQIEDQKKTELVSHLLFFVYLLVVLLALTVLLVIYLIQKNMQHKKQETKPEHSQNWLHFFTPPKNSRQMFHKQDNFMLDESLPLQEGMHPHHEQVDDKTDYKNKQNQEEKNQGDNEVYG